MYIYICIYYIYVYAFNLIFLSQSSLRNLGVCDTKNIIAFFKICSWRISKDISPWCWHVYLLQKSTATEINILFRRNKLF